MYPDSTTKRCTKCGEIKPLDQFYRDRTKSDGRARRCQACHSAAAKQRYAANPEPIRASTKQYRQKNPARELQAPRPCPKCGGTRYRASDGKPICGACRNAAKRERNAASPEKNRTRAQKWYQENYDRARQSAREAYANETPAQRAKRLQHAARYRRDNPEANRARVRDWHRRHPENRIAVKQNRRARVLGNGGSFTAQEWNDLKARYNYRCLCCGKHEPQIKLAADHIIPVTKGGSGDISNIQPLCMRCNQAKGDRHSTDYRTISEK